MRLGDSDSAFEYLNKALKLDPKNAKGNPDSPNNPNNNPDNPDNRDNPDNPGCFRYLSGRFHHSRHE